LRLRSVSPPARSAASPVVLYCPALALVFSTAPAAPRSPPLSLHDALPISPRCAGPDAGGPHRSALTASGAGVSAAPRTPSARSRSEEHTSELQSRFDLVCRPLPEKQRARHRASDDRRPRRSGLRRVRRKAL